MFYWQEDPSKIQQGQQPGKWLKVEILAVKGPMVVISTGASMIQVNVSKLKRLLNTVDLEEPRDPRERKGTPVLWHSFEGQIDVWALFQTILV